MPDGVKYKLIRADVEDCPPIRGLEFDDPGEAAQAAKDLGRERGEKLMVKIVVNPAWKKREQQRFMTEEYRHLPWEHLDWWRSEMCRNIHKEHYAHPSLERPGYLAYTKNAEDGTIDKQTILRPGAYLKQYFAVSMHYYGIPERQLVQMFMEAFGPLEVKFAVTEEEICAVYDNGPETCMMNKQWPLGKNPAHIYANGDLQVAYLGDLEHATARTLVWPAKKIYSRVYGDIARLTRGLEREGYVWGPPIGAKLKKIVDHPVKFDPKVGVPAGCFIAPYIDKKNQRGGGHLGVIEREDHLEICEAGHPGTHHCGMAHGFTGQYVPRQDEYPTYTCELCASPGHREMVSVWTAPEGGREHSWCPKCSRYHSFHCGYSGLQFCGDVERVALANGTIWAKHFADMYAKTCEMTGKLYASQYVYEVEIEPGVTKWVGSDWADRHGGLTKSSVSGKVFLRKDITRLYDRKYGAQYIGKWEVKYFGFQCDGCDAHYVLSDRHQTLKDDKLYCFHCNNRYKESGVIPISPTRVLADQLKAAEL